MPIPRQGEFFSVFLNDSFPRGIVVGGRCGFNGIGFYWKKFKDKISYEHSDNTSESRSDDDLFAPPKHLRTPSEHLRNFLRVENPYEKGGLIEVPRRNSPNQYLQFLPFDIQIPNINENFKTAVRDSLTAFLDADPKNGDRRIILMCGVTVGRDDLILRASEFWDVLNLIENETGVNITVIDLNDTWVNLIA